MFKIFQLTEQNMYVQATYRNPMFVHTFYINDMDNSLGPIHDFFFLNSVGDTILFNFVGKMSHTFGLKLDIVSEPYMTVLVLLPCSVALFPKL